MNVAKCINVSQSLIKSGIVWQLSWMALDMGVDKEKVDPVNTTCMVLPFGTESVLCQSEKLYHH